MSFKLPQIVSENLIIFGIFIASMIACYTENKQYVKTLEHFKSYDGLDKPQGITNTV